MIVAFLLLLRRLGLLHNPQERTINQVGRQLRLVIVVPNHVGTFRDHFLPFYHLHEDRVLAITRRVRILCDEELPSPSAYAMLHIEVAAKWRFAEYDVDLRHGQALHAFANRPLPYR